MRIGATKRVWVPAEADYLKYFMFTRIKVSIASIQHWAFSLGRIAAFLPFTGKLPTCVAEQTLKASTVWKGWQCNIKDLCYEKGEKTLWRGKRMKGDQEKSFKDGTDCINRIWIHVGWHHPVIPEKPLEGILFLTYTRWPLWLLEPHL